MSGYKAGADGADGAEGPAVKDAAVGERAVAEEAESVPPATCIMNATKLFSTSTGKEPPSRG